VDAIIEFAGNPGQLNRMQRQAFAEACHLFRWRDRGIQFRRMLAQLPDHREEAVAGAYP